MYIYIYKTGQDVYSYRYIFCLLPIACYRDASQIHGVMFSDRDKSVHIRGERILAENPQSPNPANILSPQITLLSCCAMHNTETQELNNINQSIHATISALLRNPSSACSWQGPEEIYIYIAIVIPAIDDIYIATVIPITCNRPYIHSYSHSCNRQ